MDNDTTPQAVILPNRRQEHRLVNAARETGRRGLGNIPIVDCDSHVYETSSFPEIIRYMENPNMRRSFERGSPEYIQAHLIPQSIGERSVGGRLPISETLHDAPFEESDDMHPVAAATIRAMDNLAIDYTILFPTPMLNLGIHPDAAVEVQLGWAFNRWLIEDVLPGDARLFTMPYLPLADVSACLRFIEAFGDKPSVLGFMITCLRYQPFHRNEFMKVFAALNERSLPVAFHSGPNWYERPFSMLGTFMGAHALGFPFYAMTHLTNVVLSGLPERFPNIRWVYMEAGQAWVPFLIARLDGEYKQRSAEVPLLKRLPGEYIRDMYFATQPFEVHGDPADTRAVMDLMNGTQSLLYASDYPHPDFDTPALIYDLPCLTEEEKRAILGGNALEVFNLPAPATRHAPATTSAA